MNIKIPLVAAIAISTVFTVACSGQPESKAQDAKQGEATMVFTNAKVYTVNQNQPWAEAVAISDNEIVYVGDSDGARAYIGSDTETHDLNGKMIVPGFFAAHEHLIAAGLDISRRSAINLQLHG